MLLSLSSKSNVVKLTMHLVTAEFAIDNRHN